MVYLTFRYFHLNFTVILILLFFVSCKPKTSQQRERRSANEYQEVKITRIKFNFDQSFEVKEIKKSASFSDIIISGIGFLSSSNSIKFEWVNPLENFLVGDLDSDGFEELYLITRSVGSDLKEKIIGITSIKGKSYKAIFIPDFDKKINVNFQYLQGYKGHDSIYLKDMHLYREFPVLNESTSDRGKTLSKRLIEYKLINMSIGNE